MNADGLSHNYYNMDKKDIQKKIEKWKRPSLKIHYLEKVLKNPRLLRKETRIAAIDILAGLNSQVEDYLNSAFLYEKIGKNKEAIDQLRMASKFGSSNDSPLKSYEKAAKELEKKGHKEYAKKAWKNAFYAVKSELKDLGVVTGVPYRKAINLAMKAEMYSEAIDIKNKYKKKASQLERPPESKANLLEKMLMKAFPIILITTSIILIISSENRTTGFFILDKTGTLNYPLLIAFIIFVLAISIIIRNERKSKP
ncbi:MAG TPA: hypothetical protein ENH46_01465 [Candidatus Pacearchaeota archaeon]|nr:hypothetical protein [Candidatus Pacearchaeota archaeon]